MSKFNRYLALLPLLAIGYGVNAIVIRHTGTTNEAVALACGNVGIYNDFVGRVYYKGDQRSTTPAAIIHEDRALVFTNKPREIESIELNEKKYKVVGIKEIIQQDEGILVCCTVEEKFNLGIDPDHGFFHEHCTFSINSIPMIGTMRLYDIGPFSHPHKTIRYKTGHIVHEYEECSTAKLIGFGINYHMEQFTKPQNEKPTKRAEAAAEGFDADALKAADACVYYQAGGNYLWCPFDNEGITFTDKRGICWDTEGRGYYDGAKFIPYKDEKDSKRFINDGDSRIPQEYRAYIAEHQKNQGYVGPDDLGALLINVADITVTKTVRDPKDRVKTKTITLTIGQQNLLGFACKAGDKDITDPKKPFYPRVSTFLNLARIYKTHGLDKISTADIPKGYTTIEGKTTPLNQDVAPKKLKPILNVRGYPIRNHHILIDPFVAISTSPFSRKARGILDNEYRVEKTKKLGNFNLVFYSKPILEVNPLPLFRGVNVWDLIQEQKMCLASPGSFFTLEESINEKKRIPRYVAGFTNSSDIQFTLEDRTKIDAVIITHALENYY